MLTTPRAIVAAALIVGASLAGRELLPRYDIRQTGPIFVRVDRWLGTGDILTRQEAHGWLTDSSRPALDLTDLVRPTTALNRLREALGWGATYHPSEDSAPSTGRGWLGLIGSLSMIGLVIALWLRR